MTDENDQPPPSKLTRSKERWAREGRFLTGKTSRPEEQRLPPGQHLTKDWPVLDLGLTPQISRERWRLDVYGAVENPIFWDWAQFTGQPQTRFTSDIHCVTTWSRYDNQWEGLATRDFLMACRPRDEAHYVVLHSHDGYTTNLPLEDFAAEDALLCVVCRTAPDAPPEKAISIIAVERPAPGIVFERAIESVGHRAHLTPQFGFENVSAPRHNLLGEEGGGLALTAASFTGTAQVL